MLQNGNLNASPRPKWSIRNITPERFALRNSGVEKSGRDKNPAPNKGGYRYHPIRVRIFGTLFCRRAGDPGNRHPAESHTGIIRKHSCESESIKSYSRYCYGCFCDISRNHNFLVSKCLKISLCFTEIFCCAVAGS